MTILAEAGDLSLAPTIQRFAAQIVTVQSHEIEAPSAKARALPTHQGAEARPVFVVADDDLRIDDCRARR